MYKKKHGMANTPEYHCWESMKQRCLNYRNPAYPSYGGRGVTVCEAWLEFTSFYRTMGRRPTPKHSLDRINNDGEYSPTNCRWTTKTIQSVNKRILSNNTSGHTGVYRQKQNNNWYARLRINGQYMHLGSYASKKDAIKARRQAELSFEIVR